MKDIDGTISRQWQTFTPNRNGSMDTIIFDSPVKVKKDVTYMVMRLGDRPSWIRRLLLRILLGVKLAKQQKEE